MFVKFQILFDGINKLIVSGNQLINYIHRVNRMGSQINRALYRNDRRRRVPESQQREAKFYVKVFNCSMIAILLFGDAFMTSHSTEAHQKCYFYFIISILSSILMNSSNPQILLVCGWLMVISQSIFMNQKVTLLFNLGTYLTLYSIFTNIYNYFDILHPPHNFVKNLVSGSLIIIMGSIYRFGHCSSHLTKQLSPKISGAETYQQHGLGIRVMFSILGAMIIVLVVIGHGYIRNRRYIPLSLSQQFSFLKQFGVISTLQLALLLVGLRSLMLQAQSEITCTSGGMAILELALSSIVVGLFSWAIYSYLVKSNEPRQSIKVQLLSGLMLIFLYTISVLISLPFLITYTLYLCLCTLITTLATNMIQNQLRVSYVLAFITGIICQTNKFEHSHNKQVKGYQNLTILSICLTLGILFDPIYAFLKSKFTRNQLFNAANPEVSSLMSISI